MKRVILYGIRGKGRKEVENFLSDSYEIIGYSDSDARYQDCQYINYSRFFKPDELKDIDFDYLIITPLNLDISNEIVGKIVERGGIQRIKIIQYALFYDVQYPHPHEIFKKVSNLWKFEGFILGMSHAYRGIDINFFHEPVFNFGFNSNDLFYYYYLMKKLYSEDVDRCLIQYCILELPYYIFNWDRSLSRSAFRSMNSYTILGQYHHMNIVEENLIEQYRIFEDMFKTKKMCNASVCNTGIYDVKDSVADKEFTEISHVWKQEHPETQKENMIYFQELIALLRQINQNMKIYVAVFPQNPRFYKRHEEIIDKVKKQFYGIIEGIHLEDVTILDYFKIYEQREDYFEDDCHLNTSGRNAFTRTIIQDLGEI